MEKKTDKQIVRLMILAAILVLGILYFNTIILGIRSLWEIATPLVVGGVIAYILNIVNTCLIFNFCN